MDLAVLPKLADPIGPGARFFRLLGKSAMVLSHTGDKEPPEERTTDTPWLLEPDSINQPMA